MSSNKESREVKPIPQSFLEHAVESSLVSFLDQPVCVHTFDGTMFVGDLAAFDQTNGISLQNARQRWYCNGKFHEVEIGPVYVVGANVCIVATRDDTYLNDCEEVTYEEILAEIKADKSKTVILQDQA